MIALSVVVFIAAAKEIYDYFNPANHTVDEFDFLATVLGGLVVIMLKIAILNL